MIKIPYPEDLEAKGWHLDLDYERIERSDTWAIASAEQRPWLLMLWLVSWRQSPVATLPNDPRLIAARIGLPLDIFERWKEVLLSGWQVAENGRLYHKTLTEHVLVMVNKRVKDRNRVSAWRERKLPPKPEKADNHGVSGDLFPAASDAFVTRYTDVTSSELHVSTTPSPSPSEIPKEKTSKKKAADDLDLHRPLGVSDATWRDFKSFRKTKRATISETVMKAFAGECQLAGIDAETGLQLWIQSGYQGFRADWHFRNQKKSIPTIPDAYSKQSRKADF